MSSSVAFAKYASVIFELAIGKPLDYGVSKTILPQVQLGSQVEVPLRGKKRTGYVIAFKKTSSFPQTQPILSVLSPNQAIPPDLLELAHWIASYYLVPLHKVLKILLPTAVRKNAPSKQQLYVKRKQGKKQLQQACKELRTSHPSQALILDCLLQAKSGLFLSELLEQSGCSKSPVDTLVKKGLLLVETISVDRSPLENVEFFPSKPKSLTDEQKHAFTDIQTTIDEKRFQTHLLFGVTGSGKTEIYLQTIDYVLKRGQGAIVLVPEIALTAQTIERFQSRFQGKIAVLHHRLSPGERRDAWHKIHQGKAPIVIGARSAIFAPVPRLGLIVVDEEQEQSYKQTDEAPCYNARDVAVMRGKLARCPVILGSATPSIESYHNAQSGKYLLNSLTKRTKSTTLPTVTIVDMKREFEKNKGFTNFSDTLLTKLKEKHASGEQAILFLNRRGYHTSLLCLACGKAISCPHCDLSLTFHKQNAILSCHLCEYSLRPPKHCPSCGEDNTLKFRGVGTELIEKSLQAILPDLRTLRVDGSTTKHKGSHQKLLKQFSTGKADVLIGTQMIAKGLHFPEVTLVAVLNCDSGLNIPDFRASETTFQLITQVAGRAGRGEIPGEVIIQTAIPENETIQLAAKQDFPSFYEQEIAIRELFRYPPFCRLIKIGISGLNPMQTERIAENCRQKLSKLLPSECAVHPVTPSGYPKIKDRWRFHFLIRTPNIYRSTPAIATLQKQLSLPPSVRIHIDINPLSTFF